MSSRSLGFMTIGETPVPQPDTPRRNCSSRGDQKTTFSKRGELSPTVGFGKFRDTLNGEGTSTVHGRELRHSSMRIAATKRLRPGVADYQGKCPSQIGGLLAFQRGMGFVFLLRFTLTVPFSSLLAGQFRRNRPAASRPLRQSTPFSSLWRLALAVIHCRDCWDTRNVRRYPGNDYRLSAGCQGPGGTHFS